MFVFVIIGLKKKIRALFWSICVLCEWVVCVCVAWKFYKSVDFLMWYTRIVVQ